MNHQTFGLVAAFLLVLLASTQGTASNPEPVTPGASEVPILMPNSPGVPGRDRPEGLLCVLGDDRVRLSGYPTRIIATPDGQRLFAVTSTRIVDVIDAKTLTITESFRASNDRVLELAAAPDGRRLAATALDGSVTLWDVSSTPARQLQKFLPFQVPEKKAVWLNLSTSRDRSRFCVSADSGVTVYEWSADGLKTLFQRQAEFAWRPALLAPGGQRLVVRTKKPSEFQLWDLAAASPQVLDRMQVDTRFPEAIIFKDDDTFLAGVSFGEELSKLVSIAGDKLQLSAVLESVATDPFRRPLFLDSGRLCVAAEKMQGPAIFDCSREQWRVIQAIPRQGSKGPMLLGSSSNDRALFVAIDQVLSKWVRDGDRFVDTGPGGTERGSIGQIQNLSFLRDGTLVFSTHETLHAVSLGEPSRPRPLAPIRLKSPLQGTTYIVPHPTDREFVIVDISSSGSLVQLRDRGQGFEEIQRFSFGGGPKGYEEAPWSAGYTPDGTTVAVGFWDRSISLYSNGLQGLALRSKKPNAADLHVCVLTFAPDGRSLACGDFGSNARIFAFDGELGAQTVLPKFGEAVRHAQFSPDGSRLVLGAQNGEIRLINLATNSYESKLLLLPDEQAPVPNDPRDSVTSLSWVADGKLLLTAKTKESDTRVCLWKMPSAELVQSWTFTGGLHAAIDHDGFVVAVARSDGTVCVMQVSDDVQRWISEGR